MQPKTEQPAGFKNTKKPKLEMKINGEVPGVASSSKLPQKEFAKLISRSSGIKQYIVEEVLYHMRFATLSALLDGKAVVIPEMFKIYVKESKPRRARNPNTGEEFMAEPRLLVKTKTSLALKKVINGKENIS